MKSYKVVEFGKPLQKVEEANPAPQGGEVLVRITAAGVCHSDVHLWEGYFDMGGGNKVSTQKTMNPPRTMGHEIVGEVVAVGPDSKGAKVGDKAVVYPWIGCGECWYCQNGIEHLCPTRGRRVNNDGSYADRNSCRMQNTSIPMATHRPARLPLCSGITAFGAVKKAVVDGGKPIPVIGAGGVA
jgi:alcohol dehydrogenase/propanol-preferring alcohol dehydrogenase